MSNILPFRYKHVAVLCGVCGRELQAVHLIILLITNEATCADCFAWSGREMLKHGTKK